MRLSGLEKRGGFVRGQIGEGECAQAREVADGVRIARRRRRVCVVEVRSQQLVQRICHLAMDVNTYLNRGSQHFDHVPWRAFPVRAGPINCASGPFPSHMHLSIPLPTSIRNRHLEHAELRKHIIHTDCLPAPTFALITVSGDAAVMSHQNR